MSDFAPDGSSSTSSIPLTLGLPPRAPKLLTHGLLATPHSDFHGNGTDLRGNDTTVIARAAGVLPVHRASSLIAGAPPGQPAARIVVHLDVDPARLRERRAAHYEEVRFELDCTERDLAEALTVRVPAPLALFVSDLEPAFAAEQIVAAGRIPGLSLAGSTSAQISDFLAVLAHADVGFVARAADKQDVLALLCGTVAALRGDDTRRALRSPDPTVLTSLGAEAADAVREVLTCIEVPDPGPVLAMFVEIGLAHR